MDSEKKDNAVSTYEHFIHVCAEHGLSEQEVRGFLEYQVLTDFVLTNTDRHLNNFGILRDSQTLKFVLMAPIFDSGNSMFWDAPRLPERSDCTEITVNSFRKTETELLKLITDRSRVTWICCPAGKKLQSCTPRTTASRSWIPFSPATKRKRCSWNGSWRKDCQSKRI